MPGNYRGGRGYQGFQKRWQQHQGGYRPTATAYHATAEHERSGAGNETSGQENAQASHSGSHEQEQEQNADDATHVYEYGGQDDQGNELYYNESGSHQPSASEE